MRGSAAQTATTATGGIEYAGHLTIAVSVRDFAAAVDWYTDVLGAEVVYRMDDLGWGELTSSVPSVTIGLSQTEDVPSGGITPTWAVADLDAARAHLERKGVRLDELVELPGLVRLSTFYDPDGNPWMLAQSLREEAPASA